MVPIRATLGSSAAEIAQLLGWSTATVHVLHSRWAKEGEAIFDVRRRGGRHHQHLTVEQEAQLAQLREMGCEHVQGFLLSHPLRAEDTYPLIGAVAPAVAVAS